MRRARAAAAGLLALALVGAAVAIATVNSTPSRSIIPPWRFVGPTAADEGHVEPGQTADGRRAAEATRRAPDPARRARAASPPSSPQPASPEATLSEPRRKRPIAKGPESASIEGSNAPTRGASPSRGDREDSSDSGVAASESPVAASVTQGQATSVTTPSSRASAADTPGTSGTPKSDVRDDRLSPTGPVVVSPPAGATAPPYAATAPSDRDRPAVLVAPVPLTKPAPGYPEPTLRVERSGLSAGARAAAAQGRVRLRVLVRADGGVDRVDVLVSTGSPELDASAVASLSQWRFAPATRDGVAIDAYYSLWISFRLD